MPSYAEISNDMKATAASLQGTHINGVMMTDYAAKMRRAAKAIDELLQIKAELEHAAEAAEQKYEDYFYGRDLPK